MKLPADRPVAGKWETDREEKDRLCKEGGSGREESERDGKVEEGEKEEGKGEEKNKEE